VTVPTPTPTADHRVTVLHDHAPMSTSRGCRAFCNTCHWSGRWVKFAHTAQRHADAHSGTYQGQHRASA
jgi:hypothetical protein